MRRRPRRRRAFEAALDDDLNTPLAIAALYDLLGQLNSAAAPADKARLAGELRAAGAVLGVLQQDPGRLASRQDG